MGDAWSFVYSKALCQRLKGNLGGCILFRLQTDGNVQPLYSAHLQLVSSEYLWLCNVHVHGNLKNEYIYLSIVHTTSDIEGKYVDWNFICMVGKFASFLKPSLPDSKRFISCRLMNIMYWMIDKKFWKVGSLDLNAEFTFVRLLFYNKSLQIEK